MGDIYGSYAGAGDYTRANMYTNLGDKKSPMGNLFGSGGGEGGGGPSGAEAAAGNIAGGVEGVASFFNAFGQEKDFYDRNIQSRDVMFGGVPTYGGVSSARQEAGAIDPNVAGKGLVGQGALAGGKLGATVGSFVGPWGTAIGAAVGGLAGTIGGLFAKKKVKGDAEDLKTEATSKFKQTQGRYNEVIGDYYEGVDTSRAGAQADRNYRNRVFNIDNRVSPFSRTI